MREWWTAQGFGVRATVVIIALVGVLTVIDTVHPPQRVTYPSVFVPVNWRVYMAIRTGDCLKSLDLGDLRLTEGADKQDFCQYRAALQAECKREGKCKD